MVFKLNETYIKNSKILWIPNLEINLNCDFFYPTLFNLNGTGGGGPLAKAFALPITYSSALLPLNLFSTGVYINLWSL